MDALADGVSSALRLGSVAGGVVAGLIAVRLAQWVSDRMDLPTRHRPAWWWAAAVLLAAGFGWFVTLVVAPALVPAFLLFAAATLGLALIDIDHQLLPNRLLFPALGAGMGLILLGVLVDGFEGDVLLRAVLGGLVYFIILFLVELLARGGFGMGDVKLGLLLGLFLAYLGWDRLAVGFSLAILTGGVVAVLLLVFTKKGRDSKFAYGPYLVAGAWVAILWGEEIANWYLGRSG